MNYLELLVFYLRLILKKNKKFASNTYSKATFTIRPWKYEKRKKEDGSRLNSSKAFSLNRVEDINNFETGLSASLGFDYKIRNSINKFDFSVAQIINEKEK